MVARLTLNPYLFLKTFIYYRKSPSEKKVIAVYNIVQEHDSVRYELFANK